jgi:RHS repeat-associated protein
MVQQLDPSAPFARVARDYDAVGRLARVSRVVGGTNLSTLASTDYTNFLYDNASRLTSTTYPAENDVTVPPGQMVRSYDWLSVTDYHLDKVGDTVPQLIRTTTVDARDDVVATANTDPVTGHVATTSFVYGAFGALKKVVDAQGDVTSMINDPWDRRKTLVDPDTGTTSTAFNAFDEATSDTTPRGTTIHSFDNIGRWFNDSGPDGVTTLTWDTAPNGLGEPAAAASPDSVGISWAYDPATRVHSTTWTVPGETASLSIVRNRDPFGRLSSVAYPPSGSYDLTAVYDYSPTGYLATVSRQDGSTKTPLWAPDTRFVDGQITHEIFGDGTAVAQTESIRTYSPTGRLLTQLTNNLATAQPLRSVSYDYDGLARLRTRSGDGFAYDFFSRLSTWNHANGSWTETYNYDDIGNLTQRLGIAATGTIVDETFGFGGGSSGAGPHGLSSGPDGSYTYDEIGNQKSAPGRRAAFWEFGLPKQVTTNAITTTFKYDALRARVVKSNDHGSSTISIGGLYEKRVDGGQTTYANFVLGERGVVAQVEVDSGGVHFKGLVDDHLGSTVLVTDQTGAATSIDFDPWGQHVTYDANGVPVGVNMSVPDVRIGFTGHDQDDDLGLINMRGRLYDAHQRRFISPDPFVNDPFDGQSHNRYAYVLNNPLNFIDPSGFDGTAAGSSGEGDIIGMPSNPFRSVPEASTGVKSSGVAHLNPVVDPPHRTHHGHAASPVSNGGLAVVSQTTVSEAKGPPPGAPAATNDSINSGGPGGPAGSNNAGGGGGQGNGTRTLDLTGFNLNVQPQCSTCTWIEEVGKIVTPQNPYEFMAAPMVPGVMKKAGQLLKGGYKAFKAARAAKALEKATRGRAGAQARLLELLKDPKVSSADRGWIQQEINSIKRGTRDSIRNPPGKDLAHSRGREAAKGYSHVESPSQLQDRDLHQLQHKFDDFGRSNPERP